MRSHWLSVTALAAVVVAGCTGGAGEPPLGEFRLVSGTAAGRPLTLLESHPVTLEIEDGRVGGVAACNHYGARLESAGGRWSVGDLEQTAMGCEPAQVMVLEEAYLDALDAADRYEMDDAGLVLTGDGVELRFERVPG